MPPTREQLGQLARMRRQETFIGPRARRRGGGARLGSGTALTLRRMAEQRLGAIQTGVWKPQVRPAVISGPRGLAVRALGSRAPQIQAIVRQQLARIPFSAKVAGVGGAVIGAERVIEATTGRTPAGMVYDLSQRGRDVFDTGKKNRRAPVRRQPMASGSVQHVLVRTWQTFPGGPVFARYADGHIEVQKKDGTIKHYRPYRPVVIPRKWDARSMRRVATALKRQRKTATKILQLTGGVPKRTVRVERAHRSVDV